MKHAVTGSTHKAAPAVLVVDDEPSMLRVLDRLLALHEFSPLQASDDAQATLIAQREQVDAFIVDLTLGRGHSGLELVAWLRRQHAYTNAPIFILTGNMDMSQDEQKLIRVHRACVFFKGQSLELLIDNLRRMLMVSA